MAPKSEFDVELAASAPIEAMPTFTGKIRASYVLHVADVLREREAMNSAIRSLKGQLVETLPLGFFQPPNNFKVRRDALIRFLELEIVRLNENLVALRIIPEE